MGELSAILLPVTLDTGAQITVVSEAVTEGAFTGETTKFRGIMQVEFSGKLTNVVVLQIGGESFARTAVAVPGEEIAWTAAMNFNPKDRQEIMSLSHFFELSSQLPEEETHYLPPRIEEGTLNELSG